MPGVQKLEPDTGVVTPPAESPPLREKAGSGALASDGRSFGIKAFLGLALVAAVTVWAYGPVLFNWFAGDDFVHLSWLSQAVQHPELVIRNFHTSWLDGTTTKFYRPLISVFMFSDYLVWGTNGLGFHLTNLFFHLTSTLVLFFIVAHVQRLGAMDGTRNNLLWPLASAGLFGLYPLHPEAVSWITGRVDSIVTAFCLLSLWFYMRWRATDKPLDGALSMAALVLGLLSKEMAITLPAVFLCFELLLPGRSTGRQSPLSRVRDAIVPTLPFWLALAAYFVVRRIALGTFVGGYDNSLFFIANLKDFVLGWLSSLKMLFVPINKSLLGSHSLLVKFWEGAAGIAAALVLATFTCVPSSRRAILFVVAWLALCLLPVYKLFAIAGDLQGSRLAYLATVPLCVLLCAGLDKWQVEPPAPLAWKSIARACFATFICALAAVLLWINNQPWRQSGQENNAIRRSLDALYARIPGDPQVLFVGLPDQINGAYTCRNSLDGMTKRPQLGRDIRNCLMINPFEPIFPFGYLKDSIAESRENIRILSWSSARRSFEQVDVPAPAPPLALTWRESSLRSILRPDPQVLSAVWEADGSLTLTGRARAGLDIVLPVTDCWSVDFIKVCFRTDAGAAMKDAPLNLLYTNSFNREFELKRRSMGRARGDGNGFEVVFPLHGLPDWALGGDFRRLRFLAPPGVRMTIHEVSIVPKNSIMPVLSFANSGYMGTKGYLHVSPDKPTVSIDVDCRGIANARTWALEVTRTNLLFEEQNTTRYSSVQLRQLRPNVPGASGSISLRVNDFPSPGLYELRAWALDASGAVVGVASDHVALSMDP